MKKQLFALSLVTLLTGCIGPKQIEVTYDEFYYHTKGEAAIKVPKTAVVKYSLVCKTKNFEALGMEPWDKTEKATYHLTFNPDGTFVSDLTYEPTIVPKPITSENAIYGEDEDPTAYTFYLNPMRVVLRESTYNGSAGPYPRMQLKIYDVTYNDHYWISSFIVTEKTKYEDTVTDLVAEAVDTMKVTMTYTF